MKELLALLHEAGHTDFRDARGPLAFTQRQAAGKFTSEEATAFIERLQTDEAEGTQAVADHERRPAPADRALARVPTERLVAELRRRGWGVTDPPATTT
jgi:hypothetical protein